MGKVNPSGTSLSRLIHVVLSRLKLGQVRSHVWMSSSSTNRTLVATWQGPNRAIYLYFHYRGLLLCSDWLQPTIGKSVLVSLLLSQAKIVFIFSPLLSKIYQTSHMIGCIRGRKISRINLDNLLFPNFAALEKNKINRILNVSLISPCA